MILAKFLRTVATHCSDYESDHSRAMALLEKALRLAKLHGDANEECIALADSAIILIGIGDFMTAQIYAHKGQHLANLSGNLFESAKASGTLGICSTYFGNFPASIVHLQRARESLAICGMSGSQLNYQITASQAEVHLQKCEFAEAQSIYTQIKKNTSTDQHIQSHAYALLNLAMIDVIIGATAEEMHQNLDNARLIFVDLKYPFAIVYCDMILADLELREKCTSTASTLFQKCLHVGWGRNNESISYCLERLADVTRWNGAEVYQKYTWPVVYLAFAQRSNGKLALHKALLFLGDVCISDQDEDTAHNLFAVALEGFTCMDVHRSRAQCIQRLGDLANKRGDFAMATKFRKAARPLFEQSLQTKDVAQMDTRFAAVEDAYQKALVHRTTLHAPIEQLKQLSISADAKKLEGSGDTGENVGGDIVI
jgi:tetratricopeptide (TPR) repeat protein